MANKEEVNLLRKAFRALDLNNDGKLQKEELVEGYKRIFGDMAGDEVEKLFQRVDADGSGEIDYSGNLYASHLLLINRMDCGYYQ
jgi:calcium-dependent protein kinase